MKIVGIIAEYNPFHKGHLYHLKESLKMVDTDTSVCVMSGNFTQRGEPAMVDKWVRARMAVESGVSLVFELPFIYACNSAEYFAKGAVRVLNSTGQVTHLSFGSECGQLKPLVETAELLAWERADYKSALRDLLRTGLSYPRARQRALEECFGEIYGQLLGSPNNILAVEYLKQLLLTDSSIRPITVKRYGSDYKSFAASGTWASAMAIRYLLESGQGQKVFHEVRNFLPPASAEILESFMGDTGSGEHQKLPVTLEDFRLLLTYKITSTPEEELAEIFSVGEGLENKMKKALWKSGRERVAGISQKGEKERITATIDEIEETVLEKPVKSLVKNILSKRYTETGIQRSLIHLLMDLTKRDFSEMDQGKEIYCRLLAADGFGRTVMGKMKGQEGKLLQNRLKQRTDLSPCLEKMLRYDLKASDVYHLVTGVEPYRGSDLVHSPYVKVVHRKY